VTERDWARRAVGSHALRGANLGAHRWGTPELRMALFAMKVRGVTEECLYTIDGGTANHGHPRPVAPACRLAAAGVRASWEVPLERANGLGLSPTNNERYERYIYIYIYDVDSG
jgi:hypothetical protein